MSFLSPVNQARWARFRHNRRGYLSLWLFMLLFLCSLGAEEGDTGNRKGGNNLVGLEHGMTPERNSQWDQNRSDLLQQDDKL